jgi:site-specific recombinase XerD
MKGTVQLLREYLQEHHLERPEYLDAILFPNRHGAPLSRTGIRYLLHTYVEQARATQSTLRQPISPHTLRHSKAMHLLQCGTPLIVIRDILGHRDIKSTEIYARADLAMMRRALEKASDTPVQGERPSWQSNKTLMDWLRCL